MKAILLALLSACTFTTTGLGHHPATTASQPAPASAPAPVASTAQPAPEAPTAPPALAPAPAPPIATADRALIVAVANAGRDLGFIEENEKDLVSSGAGNQGATLIADAAACSANVARAIAAGVPTATAIGDSTIRHSHGKPLTLGVAEAEFCAPLAAKGKDWDARIASAKHGRADGFAAKYKAAGIGGDKLAFIVDEIVRDDQLLGVGGVEIDSGPELKRASVVFVLDGGADNEWTLNRYEFKGDTLVGKTSQGFAVRPGPARFR